MTEPQATPPTGGYAHAAAGPHVPYRATRTIAAVLLGVAGLGIWAPLLGGGVLWAVPILTWSLLIVAGVAVPEGRWGRAAIGLSWLPWLLVAGLLVGLPAAFADPTALGDTTRQLLDGARGATEGEHGPWTVAAWLMFVGVFWVRGAANAIKPSNAAAAWGFIYFAAPFVVAMLLGRADDAAWHGAILLAGAVLWATTGRLRAALPAVAAVALIATLAGGATGFTERQVQLAGERAQNGKVDYSLQFGPDTSPRTGAVFLEVQSPEPALWRAEVLDRFTGRTWEAALRQPGSDLPQPAARAVTTAVTVRRLNDTRAVAPGRILSVNGGAQAQRVAIGEGAHFLRAPAPGTQYVVSSEVVRASPQELATVRIPEPAQYLDQIALWPDLPDGLEAPIARKASRMSPPVAASPFGRTVTLAHDLARGTRSQLEVVRRVHDYLLDPQRFRYSRTEVPPANDPQPLLTFLTATRTGYCQHFAGAAALLLRMAGIPTRVVAGFATGKAVGGDRYRVEDADAHAWIEVYFEGYGWVPFNPTPPAADARVDERVDPLGAGGGDQRARGDSRTIGLVLLASIVLVGGVLAARALRRRRRGGGERLAELLMRLSRAPVRPATTVGAIGPDLAMIGPETSALAEVAQRERFAPGTAAVHRPRRMLWRALRRDVGRWRALRLMLFGAPRDGT